MRCCSLWLFQKQHNTYNNSNNCTIVQSLKCTSLTDRLQSSYASSRVHAVFALSLFLLPFPLRPVQGSKLEHSSDCPTCLFSPCFFFYLSFNLSQMEVSRNALSLATCAKITNECSHEESACHKISYMSERGRQGLYSRTKRKKDVNIALHSYLSFQCLEDEG